jgi:hypothetical protein
MFCFRISVSTEQGVIALIQAGSKQLAGRRTATFAAIRNESSVVVCKIAYQREAQAVQKCAWIHSMRGGV